MKKKYIYILIMVISLLLIGGTFAWFEWGTNLQAQVFGKVCTPEISFVGGDTINGTNIKPVSVKEKGIIKNIDVKLSSACSNEDTAIVNLYLELTTFPVGLAHSSFVWKLYDGETLINNGNFSGLTEGDTITLTTNQTVEIGTTTYTLYIYLDGSVDNPDSTINKSFLFNLYSTGIKALYRENIADFITNKYLEATKTQYTDSKYNITYDYAEDVNLMNDRLASMDTDINGGNIRYYGANPDNYVTFNNELWRIIGVFDGRIKIIRKDPIGDTESGNTLTFSYDTSAYNINYGYGVNQWGPSTHSSDDSTYDGANLMKLLNPGYNNNTDSICSTTLTNDGRCGENDESLTSGLVNNSLYWNASSTGKCYTGRNFTASDCNFSSSGLKDATSKAMIDEVTWNLGSNLVSENSWDGNTTASRLYNWEHSDNSGIQCTLNSSYCSSDVRGTTTWVGKVGLMSPSDYAYATGGGTTHNLNTCLSTHNAYVTDNNILNWSNTYTDCKNNDWLLDKNAWQWTIAPRAYSSYSYYVFIVYAPGRVDGNYAHSAGRVRPVVFLKPNVTVVAGTGTSDDPYILV